MAPVFVFCDPGVDDALALMILRGAGATIAAACATTGNVTAAQGANNLRYLLALLDIDAPVYAGPASAGRPARAGSPHGTSGLGEIEVPAASPAAPEMAADDIGPEERLVCLSPLTDLAWLVRQRPELGQGSQPIVVSGGAGLNAVEAATEFNLSADAEASAYVLDSGASIRLVPLRVTRQVRLDEADLATICNPGSNGHAFLRRMLTLYFDFHERERGFRGCYLHDPTGVAALLWPDLFKFVDISSRVDETQGPALGMTHFSISQNDCPDGDSHALNVAVDVEAGEVKRRLVQCIKAALGMASGLVSA